MPDETARPPRFPYVAALLCAACIGAAAWTWMRYSYCWTIAIDDLYVMPPEGTEYHANERLSQRYVRLPSGSWVEWAGEQRFETRIPQDMCVNIGDRGGLGRFRDVPTPDGAVQRVLFNVPATVVSVASRPSDGQTVRFRMEPLFDHIVMADGHMHARIQIHDSQHASLRATSQVDIDTTASRFHGGRRSYVLRPLIRNPLAWRADARTGIGECCPVFSGDSH
jgi:hypothetical protein